MRSAGEQMATMAKIRRANGNNISAGKLEQHVSDVRTNKQFSAGYIARAFNYSILTYCIHSTIRFK